MRTSLNRIKAINDYLTGQLASGDAVLFEANLLLNNELATDVQHQQNTYAIIRQYSRQKLREEIIAVQNKLATEPEHRGFMQRITGMFNKR